MNKAGIAMSGALYEALVKENVDVDVIDALALAMRHSGVDPTAYAYAHGMHRSWDEHGLEGVAWNVMYMLGNLGRWQGDEARQAKKVLKRFWKKEK